MGGFSAMVSGPGRILAKKPKKTFEKLGYSEESEVSVVALEASKLPGREVVRELRRECGVDDLYIVVARTASVVGSVQVSGRAAETALYRLEQLGEDVMRIEHVFAQAPIAPVVGSDARMMGLTNDMIIYGSSVLLYGRGALEVGRLPSSNSPAYGEPFYRVFEKAGFDFYRIDPGLFAPAEVVYNDLETGRVDRAGGANLEALKRCIREAQR
jgi:methenyltetrahydromethanopterin cyclohydrolase